MTNYNQTFPIYYNSFFVLRRFRFNISRIYLKTVIGKVGDIPLYGPPEDFIANKTPGHKKIGIKKNILPQVFTTVILFLLGRIKVKPERDLRTIHPIFQNEV